MPISPNQGTTGGGTTVTITGTNLAGATAVRFGSKLATITGNTPTSVTVTSPSGSGTVAVTVTTAAGTSNPLNFYYIGAPFKASLSAVSGPSAGGNTISITGTGLSTASSIAFGANNATPTVTSDSLLSVTVPAGTAGSVGVSVTTTGGSNNGFSYTYVDAPTIVSLTPTSGSTSGGTAVTITGTGLTTTESVTFDGVTAPFSVISSTTVSAVTPPGSAGAVDVVVNTSGGSATETDGFTYVAGPGI
ncbi:MULTISPECIES: IPT/TIG domain-containing protein [unclassified Streptomyces]|uniref:IPT/TIG domain-containing protein n=1 Tax=unclassified Streptomyces TaxID=2593676 RepID=UPI0033C00C06